MADSRRCRWSTRTLGSFAALGLVLAAAPDTALAAAGDHIRVGEAEVVPSMFLGLEWQSNPYWNQYVGFVDDDDGYGGLALAPWPEVNVNLDGPDLGLDFSLKWMPRIYLASDRRNLTRLDEGKFSLDLDLLPRGMVGFNLVEDFQLAHHALDFSQGPTSDLRKLTTSTIPMVSIRPGAALDIDIGGHITWDDYNFPEEAGEVDGNYNSRLAGGPVLNAQWAFFPKTAFTVMAAADFFNWRNNTVDARGGNFSTDVIGDVLYLPDGWTWRATGGLVGRFTERIVVNVLAGYGQMKYNEDSVSGGNVAAFGYDADLLGIDGLLLTAEVVATPLLGHTITAGYRKDFEDAYFTNFVRYHYFFGRYEAVLGSRLGTKLEAGFRREHYEGQITRDDSVIRTAFGLTYEASDWLNVDVDAKWMRRATADAPETEYDNMVLAVGITGVY